MTMSLVQTVTVGSGGAADITFTSIPQDATDLLVVCSFRDNNTAAGNDFNVVLNGSTTGYSFRNLRGSGSAASSGSSTGASAYGVFLSQSNNLTSNTFSNIQVYIPNYTSSVAKSISIDGVTETNATATWMSINANTWTGTAAITSVKVFVDGTTLREFSSASLYKITKA